MSFLVDLTDGAAEGLVWRNPAGVWEGTVVVKATFTWDETGRPVPVAAAPLTTEDEYMGDPASTGLVTAADVGPPKPRVDVLVAGAVVFPVPVDQVDVSLSVGARLRKTVRVYGERTWVPGVFAAMVPSRPRPVTRVPIMWERSFGGADPDHPTICERRNPAGTGVVRDAARLSGQMAPSFEDPGDPVESWKSRPGPVGFGPVAPHWQPRARLSGSYDEAWQARKPLLPADFDRRFFNVAPADQQLDGYVPGERVELRYMTARGRDSFSLPASSLPVTFLTQDALVEDVTRVDTILIEPEERRFSLLAKASITVARALDLRRAVLGELTPGMMNALSTGRRHPAFDRPRPRGAAR